MRFSISEMTSGGADAPISDFTTPDTKALYVPLTVTAVNGAVQYAVSSSDANVQAQIRESPRLSAAEERVATLRTVVVGASSGLGRCIGIGLAQRGAHVALLARRRARLDDAAKEAGPGTLVIECDVTDESSCRSAIDDAAAGLGGIDALVYAPGTGPLVRTQRDGKPGKTPAR